MKLEIGKINVSIIDVFASLISLVSNFVNCIWICFVKAGSGVSPPFSHLYHNSKDQLNNKSSTVDNL